MKLVKHTVEQIRAGDEITTVGWSPSSDGKPFRVVQVYRDHWLLCTNEEGKFRQFATECVRKREA